MSTTLATLPVTLTYRTPIHTLATSSDSRDPLGSVGSIMPDGLHRTGYHCATNGRTLAIVPFTLPSDIEESWRSNAPASIRCVPGKVIKGIKAVKGTRTLDTYSDGSSTGSDGTAHGGSPNGFPPVSKVLNALQEVRAGKVVISLNAKLLYELALALGSDGCVELHCDPSGVKPSIVLPIDGSVPDAVGVMMTMNRKNMKYGKPLETVYYQGLEHMAGRFASVGH